MSNNWAEIADNNFKAALLDRLREADSNNTGLVPVDEGLLNELWPASVQEKEDNRNIRYSNINVRKWLRDNGFDHYMITENMNHFGPTDYEQETTGVMPFRQMVLRRRNPNQQST